MTTGTDGPEPTAPASAAPEPAASDESGRPLIERLGLAAIAVVVAGLFGTIAYAALASGELFLGIMAGIGFLMTLWAAAGTLRRG